MSTAPRMTDSPMNAPMASPMTSPMTMLLEGAPALLPGAAGLGTGPAAPYARWHGFIERVVLGGGLMLNLTQCLTGDRASKAATPALVDRLRRG